MGRSARILLVANVIALLSILLSPLAILFTAFFDDPRAAGNPLTYVLASIIWVYPITAALGSIQAIRSYRAGDSRRMLRWTACAYSSPMIFSTIMVLGASFGFFWSLMIGA